MSDNADRTWTITIPRADSIELPALSVVVVGTTPERSAPLGLDTVVVGSGEDNPLVIDDRSVSRRHCSITLSEHGIVLRDLGSKNGTFVGKLAVREAVLVPDVVVTLGSTSIVVRVVGKSSVAALSKLPQFGQALGASVVMRALFAQLIQASVTDEAVLLLGESGTGKEVLAKAVHERSPRRSGPFVVMDCSAVAPQLFESELFGHVRGAFTGADTARVGALAHAEGGTLFLDEIGEVPLDVQPKLLRALETKQFRPLGSNDWRTSNFRLVAATHRDLLHATRSGTFRSDLYYRLAVITARIPPLRERGDDLELLTEHILAAQTPPRSLHDLPPNTLALLRSYDFPGNVRELRNVLGRLVLFPNLGPEVFDKASDGGMQRLFELPLREAREQVVEHFETSYLTANMRSYAGNVTRLAAAAGVSRTMIYRLLERHSILRADD